MIKLLKNLNKVSILFCIIIIGLVILQVYSDLKLPTRLTNILNYASLASGAIENNMMNDALKEECQNGIIKNGLEMFGFAGISLICSILVCFLAARVASSFSHNLRMEVYKHIQKFSISEIDKFSTASLITRTTNDITQIQMVIVMVLRMAIAAPTTAILGIIEAESFQTSSQLSLIVVISVITLVVLVISIFVIVLPKFKKMQELTDKLNLVTRENLTGIRVVRANCAEEYQENKFNDVNQNVSNTHIFVNRVMNLMSPGMMLIMNGTSLAILWVGSFIINENPLMLGSVFGFQQITMMIVMAFMQLIMIFIMIPRGLVSARRVREILDVNPSLSNPINPLPLTNLKGEIEYKDVSFSYPNSNESVLSNISFKANQGDTVAIIGSTGSGKTSLINLISRFFDATSGEVLVDGINVKDYDMGVLRDKIAFINQKALLFKGTIASNLRYGKKDATEEEMTEALKLALADDFVFKNSEGLNYKVAQGGSNFSGGQKQRLSIARALIKKPEVIVFDDSFSALDFKTDKALRDNLKSLDYNPTKIIVAQRIGTIMDANLILVLEEGKIVGAGTHEQLIKNCEVYQEIAYSQVSKEEI